MGKGRPKPSSRRDPRREEEEDGRRTHPPRCLLSIRFFCLTGCKGMLSVMTAAAVARSPGGGGARNRFGSSPAFASPGPTPSLSALRGERAAACRTRAGQGLGGGVAQVTWILTPARDVPSPPQPTEPGVENGRGPFAWSPQPLPFPHSSERRTPPRLRLLPVLLPSLVAISSRHSALKACDGSGPGISSGLP